jgi:hypothetical protein
MDGVILPRKNAIPCVKMTSRDHRPHLRGACEPCRKGNLRRCAKTSEIEAKFGAAPHFDFFSESSFPLAHKMQPTR